MLWIVYSLKNTVFGLFLAVFQHLKKIKDLNQKSVSTTFCADIVSTSQYKFYDVNRSRECCGFCTVVTMGLLIYLYNTSNTHISIENVTILAKITRNLTLVAMVTITVAMVTSLVTTTSTSYHPINRQHITCIISQSELLPL